MPNGSKTKVFGCSSTHYGRFCVSASASGSENHVTALVVTSVFGRKLTPFCFCRQNVMSSWIEPLNDDFYRDSDGKPHWLSTTGGFPGTQRCFQLKTNGCKSG